MIDIAAAQKLINFNASNIGQARADGQLAGAAILRAGFALVHAADVRAEGGLDVSRGSDITKVIPLFVCSSNEFPATIESRIENYEWSLVSPSMW